MAEDNGFTPEEQKERHVAALKRERAGYVAAGKTARVEAVDTELRRLGVTPPSEQAVGGSGSHEDASKQAPQGRNATGSRQSTAG